MSAGLPQRTRTQEGEEVSDALHDEVKPGAMNTTDFEVAINNGYRLQDLFFTARVGKCGSSGPFQQCIPQDFARYHPDLNLKNITLENANGGKWVVLVRPHHTVLCFSKGWRAFSKGNNLRVGDQLIFTQIGERHFKVTAYDSRGKSLGQPPIAVEALPPTATAYECRGKALAEPPHVKDEPSSPTAMPLQTLTVAVKPEYPLTHPAVLDSNLAKIILRHILPPPPSGQVSDPHITAAPTEVPVPIPAPIVDCTRDVDPKEEQNVREVSEGKDYIVLDSDEDDEVAMMTLPKSGPKIVSKPGSKVGMYCTGEQLSGVRIQSPQEKQVSTRKIEESDNSYSASESDDSDDSFPLIQTPRAVSGSMMKRRNYEKGARKKICIRQPSSKGERKNTTKTLQMPFSPSARSSITRSKHHEVRESSQGQWNQTQEENTDGEAVRLVRQQERKNFSDIVCTHRQPDFVSGKDKRHAIYVAMEFSFKLENHNFVLVMCAAQVYHSFLLPVPAKILEATQTQEAKVVEAWLTDKAKKMYMVNWSWSKSWKTPMLNNNGWAKFALDHFLEEGDVCVFELLNSTSASTPPLLFHVHIFRVEEALRDSYRIRFANTFLCY